MNNNLEHPENSKSFANTYKIYSNSTDVTFCVRVVLRKDTKTN